MVPAASRIPTLSLLIVAALVTLNAAPSGRQAQEPTFRSRTRTVPVFATVTGPDGRLVTDLGRDDFEIDDNGVRQELTVFANTQQPITVVMMLDRSGSVVADFGLVQQAAMEFVKQLAADDQARIGSFSNRIQVDPRQFTSDHEELFQILRTQLQEPGPTPLWNAVSVGMTALLHVEGRRVVLVFTDGADNPANGSNNNVSLKDAMKRAQQEDVMVYAVGLLGMAPGPRGMGGWGGHGRGGFGGFGFPGGGRPSHGGGATMEKPDEGLPRIAAESGGGYFELDSAENLTAAFTRVADELHHQYALGFSPQALDGKVHKIDVRIKRSDLTVRARKSYFAKPERQ